MAASQACEMIDNEEINAYVVPSKTIPQGIASAIMFNPEASGEENFKEMKSALKNVKSGEVTFSIRDSEINGVSIKKDDFIGIFEKDIVIDDKDKIQCVLGLLDKMIDDESSIVTLLVGEDVKQDEVEFVRSKFEEKYSDIDIDIRYGKQPVYSFIIGVE